MIVISFLVKWCSSDKGKVGIEDIDLYENLSYFFSVLKNQDRSFWFQEELICSDRLRIRRLPMHNLLQLVAAEQSTKNNLRSVHNYDILTNPIYSDRFLYTPCSYPERH